VLRKIEVKQLDNKWIIHLDDKPPAGGDASASAPAPDAPAAGDKAAALQETTINQIDIVDL